MSEITSETPAHSKMKAFVARIRRRINIGVLPFAIASLILGVQRYNSALHRVIPEPTAGFIFDKTELLLQRNSDIYNAAYTMAALAFLLVLLWRTSRKNRVNQVLLACFVGAVVSTLVLVLIKPTY